MKKPQVIALKDLKRAVNVAAQVPFHDLIAKFAIEKKKETKVELTKSKVDLIYLPVMNDLVNTLTIYGVSQAEDIALLITDIKDVIDAGFSDQPAEVRGRIITACLQQTLVNIRSDIARRRGTFLELPHIAPVTYIPRQSGKASDFLNEHWKPFIEGGVCFRSDIKRLDPKLEMALRNEFRGKPEALRAILPNKADEVDARLAAVFGSPVSPEKRKLAVQALSYAKQVRSPK